MFHGCLSILSNFSLALSNMEMFLHNIPMKFGTENHFSIGVCVWVWVYACVRVIFFSLAVPSTNGGTSIYTFAHRHTSMYPTRSFFFSNFIFVEVFINIHTSDRSRKQKEKNKLCRTHQKLWRRKGVYLIAISSKVECVDFVCSFSSHIFIRECSNIVRTHT